MKNVFFLLGLVFFCLLGVSQSCSKIEMDENQGIQKKGEPGFGNNWHPPMLELVVACGTECNNGEELCLLTRVHGVYGEIPSLFDHYRCSCEGCPLFLFGTIPNLLAGISDLEKIKKITEMFPMPNANFEGYLNGKGISNFVVDKIKIHYTSSNNKYGIEYKYTDLSTSLQHNILYIMSSANAGSDAIRYECKPPCTSVCLVEFSIDYDIACNCEKCEMVSEEVPHPLDPDPRD